MLRTIASYIFLIVGVVIGLGAFGHGHAVTKVHDAIDQFPIEPGIHQTLYMVWYFVSGAMLTFGATIVWVWFRLRAGSAGSLFAAYPIGALYFVFGTWAFVYRRGDPFALVFILLGALLLASSLVLGVDRQK
jgi:hypothetical protein